MHRRGNHHGRQALNGMGSFGITTPPPPLDAGRTPLYARRRDLTPEPDPLISARLACVALAGGRKGPVPMPGPFCQITRSGGHISSSRAAAGDGHDSERSGIKRTLP